MAHGGNRIFRAGDGRRNGLVDKPGTGIAEAGVKLDYGSAIGLTATIVIAVAGTMRTAETELRRPKRPPGVL